jgi:hypothetical protein
VGNFKTLKGGFMAVDLQKSKVLGKNPYGFTAVGNNWLKRSRAAQMLKDGFVIDTDIIKDFDDMLQKLKYKSSPPMINDQGEIRTFPAKSRWNPEYNYSMVVGSKALDEVKGLRDVCHVVLTVSREKAEAILPDWWAYDVEDYLAVRGGEFVTEFLRKYRAYQKKIGSSNRFVTWVMEFQEKNDDMVHFHLLFYGRYIAPLEKMIEWWPLSEPQGVRLGKPIKHNYAGDALARYLTRYISKDLERVREMRRKRMAAFLWYFKRRLYNMRHHIKNSDGKYTLGIGRDAYVSSWKRCFTGDEINKAEKIKQLTLELQADKLLGIDKPYSYYFKGGRLKVLELKE